MQSSQWMTPRLLRMGHVAMFAVKFEAVPAKRPKGHRQDGRLEPRRLQTAYSLWRTVRRGDVVRTERMGRI